MTQTIPRLMSFPTERTEILLRFESGQAVANAIAAGVGLGLGNCLIAFGRKPGGVEKAFGLPPHYRFTWGHAVGYPLESADAGGQRPRLKFDRLFHDNAFGRPFASDPATVELLREKGLIQEQAPLPGRFEEIVAIAERHGRDPGLLHFPAREIRRLLDDDDWDLGPRAARARRERPGHRGPAGLPGRDARDVPAADGGARHRRRPSSCRPTTDGAGWPTRTSSTRSPAAGRRSRSTAPSASTPSAAGPSLELCEAFEAAADDEAVGVIVFTGAGERAFCVGGDVREPTRTMAREARRPHRSRPRLATAMRDNGKPIVCRVRGYCIGGGNELNMISDLTISGTSGRFGQAGPRIGNAPLWWGSQLIPAVVGEKRGREVLFVTRQYSAEEALAMGLVNAVVARRGARRRGRPLVRPRSCAARPRACAWPRSPSTPRTDALYSSTNHGMELMALNHVHGPEPKEGIASFQEKRPADWRKFRDGQGPEPA